MQGRFASENPHANNRRGVAGSPIRNRLNGELSPWHTGETVVISGGWIGQPLTGLVAQLAEQRPPKPKIRGSTPCQPAKSWSAAREAKGRCLECRWPQRCDTGVRLPRTPPLGGKPGSPGQSGLQEGAPSRGGKPRTVFRFSRSAVTRPRAKAQVSPA